MAEQEVVKHTKKIYNTLKSPEHSWWHKIKEFLIEIFIIVFAISLSIWFHNRSEHAHQETEVKEFLLGLRDDMKNDIREMGEDIKSYAGQKKLFDLLSAVKMTDQINIDSFSKYKGFLNNSTELIQNNGRFEGFKSAGKMGLIEDKILQNDIMDVYQENIPSLLTSTGSYVKIKDELSSYIRKTKKRVTDSTNNLVSILLTEEGRNYSLNLSSTDYIVERYAKCIEKMKSIIDKIEKIYALKANEVSSEAKH